MEHTIKIGQTGVETKIVELSDTASALGSGLAEVFATPALVALMENVAYKSIEKDLPQGHSSVGIQINVKHNKASLPGTIITCESKVTAIDGKKVFFTIEASDSEGPIGSCEHIRYIIDSKQFMEKLKK